MRHIDYLFDGWDLRAENDQLRAQVAEVREHVDLTQIALDCLLTDAEGPPIGALFTARWFGLSRIWAVRPALRPLIWLPLVDDRRRPLVPFLLTHARATDAQLRAIERADDAVALVEQLRKRDRELTDVVKRQVLQLTDTPSELRCPQCGGEFVSDEEYFGNVRMLGCKLCAHAESGRTDEEREALLRRWSPN